MGSSSPTRNQMGLPALGTQSLSHWTTREVPRLWFSKQSKLFFKKKERKKGEKAQLSVFSPKQNL